MEVGGLMNYILIDLVAYFLLDPKALMEPQPYR